jgi:hypothetical protein
MEPPKPQMVKVWLNQPQVAPEEVEEYERLLAERFTEDPDRARSPQEVTRASLREARLTELYKKLFPGEARNP